MDILNHLIEDVRLVILSHSLTRLTDLSMNVVGIPSSVPCDWMCRSTGMAGISTGQLYESVLW